MKQITCKVCNGRGQTKATETVAKFVDGIMQTIQRGSGCPRCLGRGVVEIVDGSVESERD